MPPISLVIRGGQHALHQNRLKRVKRIAIVFEFGTLNGGEHSMLAVVDRLKADFEFVAIAPEAGRLADRLKSERIEHIPLTLRDEANARLPRDAACRNLVKAVKQCSPDLLHANSLSMGRLTGAIAGDIDVPCAAHLRDIIKLSNAAIEDLNRNDVLIAVSHATRKFHVEQGLEENKTGVVYNGVDCELFHPEPSTGVLKTELQIPDDGFLVATIGQIGLRKAQDVLAAAAILASERLPEAHYLLVGERNSSKAESIEFERNVARRFDEAGIGNQLHQLGYSEDIDFLMNESDLLVHCAHQEPLGRVLLEAAAAGLPIVATNVGGTSEILQDGVSARLIPANDPQALAAAIIESYDDPNQRDEFSSAARKRVESLFNVDRAARALAEVWQIV